jgi:hypothetical protein
MLRGFLVDQFARRRAPPEASADLRSTGTWRSRCAITGQLVLVVVNPIRVTADRDTPIFEFGADISPADSLKRFDRELRLEPRPEPITTNSRTPEMTAPMTKGEFEVVGFQLMVGL